MNISERISSRLSGASSYDDDEDEEFSTSWSSWWWDTKQKFIAIPGLVVALFVKPEHDDIQDARDLVYQYGQAVKHIPSLLRRLAFKTRTLEDELHEAMLRGSLRKVLHGFDLLMIGLGVVIGSGAFSLTGQAQSAYAGSALIVSYAIAGLACCCSAACYAELCMEYPVSGSAFTYIMVTFGEYPAFITLGMLLLEYSLGMAAVANGFSQFLALLVNQSATIFIFDDEGIQWDIMALSIVLILSAALSFGVKESSFVLGGATIIKLLFITGISIVGFAKAQGSYFVDNFGLGNKRMDGVFQGTAFIFFAFVAFDAVCNAVEETLRPNRIPKAIIGTVVVSSVVYMMMSASLSLIVEPATLMQCSDDRGNLLNPQPPTETGNCTGYGQPAYTLAYIVAFNEQNLPWMQYIVAIAALLGITTSLLVGLYSVARIAMVAARTWLLPPPLAHISPRTQTPVIAQMTLGFIIAIIAMVWTFTRLSELASLGALFAMWIVSNAVLYRRYYPSVKLRYTAHGTVEAELSTAQWWMPGAIFPRKARRVIVWIHIICINAMCLGYVIYYRLSLYTECIGEKSYENPICQDDNVDTASGLQRDVWVLAWIIAWGGVTISMFFLCPLEYRPKTWAIKPWLLPFLPSFAILLIIFSAGSMGVDTFIIFGYYVAAITVIYIFISMPLSYIRRFTIGNNNAETLQVVELVEVDGKFVPWDSLQHTSSGITNYMTVDPSGRGYSTFSVGKTMTMSVGSRDGFSSGSEGGPAIFSANGSPVKGITSSEGGGNGAFSPRRQQSYRMNTKASGVLPRLQEDAEEEEEEEVNKSGQDGSKDCGALAEEEKKDSVNAVDSAYDRV